MQWSKILLVVLFSGICNVAFSDKEMTEDMPAGETNRLATSGVMQEKPIVPKHQTGSDEASVLLNKEASADADQGIIGEQEAATEEKNQLLEQLKLLKDTLQAIAQNVDKRIAELEKESADLQKRMDTIIKPETLNSKQRQVLDSATALQQQLHVLKDEVSKQKALSDRAMKHIQRIEAKFLTY